MSALRPIESNSVSDTAFERLVEAITSGEYAPGQKLSETDLASKLGISRIPLREALGRLEGKLVTRTPRLGTRVIELSSSTLEQLFYVREALEGMAARLAAENATTGEIAALSELLALEQTRCGPNAEKYLASDDEDFHFRIIQASRCEQLEKLLLETVYYRLRIYRARARIDINRAKAAMAEHREVAAALLARDSDGAERAMRHHIRTSRQNLISRLNLKRPKASTG
jgi:DNA-binding GntR family transcriptional regulator